MSNRRSPLSPASLSLAGTLIILVSVGPPAATVGHAGVEREGVFCAPCHQFSFWDTPIYQSFR